MYTQKIANIFDHIQDHSRLCLENKFLENKSRPSFFCVRQVYFANSCQQIWECLNQPFIIFIHHIWGETTLFIIQTSYKMQYFINFQDKLHSVNIQNDTNRWRISENFQNHPYGQLVLVSIVRAVSVVECWMNFNRVTLQHNSEFIIICFVI